jgi:hypothetical protein
MTSPHLLSLIVEAEQSLAPQFICSPQKFADLYESTCGILTRATGEYLPPEELMQLIHHVLRLLHLTDFGQVDAVEAWQAVVDRSQPTDGDMSAFTLIAPTGTDGSGECTAMMEWIFLNQQQQHRKFHVTLTYFMHLPSAQHKWRITLHRIEDERF